MPNYSFLFQKNEETMTNMFFVSRGIRFSFVPRSEGLELARRAPLEKKRLWRALLASVSGGEEELWESVQFQMKDFWKRSKPADGEAGFL
jgi:hypothetical protein